MPQTTQIVTIDDSLLDDLREWVEARSGSVKRWNLALGDYGHQYLDQEHSDLIQELRIHLAIESPELHCPPWSELPYSLQRSLLESAASSYSWMHEGYLEIEDAPHMVQELRHVVTTRPDVALPDPDSFVQALNERGKFSLPDWDELNPTARAIFSDFMLTSSYWLNDRIINGEIVQTVRRHRSSLGA